MKTLNPTVRFVSAVAAAGTTLAIFTAVVSGPQREVLLAGARPAAAALQIASADPRCLRANVLHPVVDIAVSDDIDCLGPGTPRTVCR